MAKKTIASLQTESNKDYIKVIKMRKNENGNYKFVEKIVKRKNVDEYLQK